MEIVNKNPEPAPEKNNSAGPKVTLPRQELKRTLEYWTIYYGLLREKIKVADMKLQAMAKLITTRSGFSFESALSQFAKQEDLSAPLFGDLDLIKVIERGYATEAFSLLFEWHQDRQHLKNAEYMIQNYRDRITMYEPIFEADSAEANAGWDAMLKSASEMVKKYPGHSQQLQLILLSYPQTDVRDQEIKNETYKAIKAIVDGLKKMKP